MFCDSVQFSIELNKKGKELKEVSDTANKDTDTESKLRASFGKTSGLELNDYRNSRNLFRWAKKQVIIVDNSEENKEKSLVFFLKEDKKLLTRQIERGSIPQQRLDILDDGTEANDMDAVLQYMEDVLKDLEQDVPDDAESIVALIDKEGTFKEDGHMYKKQFKQMGIDFQEELNKWVWTFKEFKEFNRKLTEALKAGTKCSPTGIENIVNCEIEPVVDDADDLLITNEMLRKMIAEGNLRFVVGIRNIESVTVDDKLGRKVMGEALDLDEVKDKLDGYGYGNFEQFYDKVIEFESYLAKDGYSKGLLKDVANKYQEAKVMKFGEDWAIGLLVGSSVQSTAQGNSKIELENPGLYKVLLDYDFSTKAQGNAYVAGSKEPDAKIRLASADTPFSVGLALEKGLKEIDSDNGGGTAYAKNLFFELPFDGELGKNQREGYGITYGDARGKEFVKVVYDDSKAQEEDRMVKLYGSTVGGVKKYKLDYGEDFLSTNTGTIMAVSKDTIEFNPSTATRVELELKARQGDGPEGVIYDIIESNGADRSLLDKYRASDEYKTKSWFSWKSESGEFGDKTYPKQQAQALCNEFGLENRHGFVEDLKGQQTSYVGVAFVPFERTYQLSLGCNQGSATANALTPINANAGSQGGGRIAKLNSEGGLGTGTIKSYLEKIKDRQVCVVTGESTMGLAWNRERIYEKDAN